MNQLDGLTILVDAAAQLPETRHLKSALKWGNKRLEVLRLRKQKRDARRAALAEAEAEAEAHLAQIAKANPERFIAAGRCPHCGYFKEACICPPVLLLGGIAPNLFCDDHHR